MKAKSFLKTNMYRICHQQTCTTRNIKGSSSSIIETIPDGELYPHKDAKKMSEIDAQNDGDSSLTVTEAETKTTDSTFISEVL